MGLGEDPGVAAKEPANQGEVWVDNGGISSGIQI